MPPITRKGLGHGARAYRAGGGDAWDGMLWLPDRCEPFELNYLRVL